MFVQLHYTAPEISGGISASHGFGTYGKHFVSWRKKSWRIH